MTDATQLDEAAIRARWTRPKREDYQGPGADIAHSMAVLQWSLSRGKEAVTDVPLLLAALDEAREQADSFAEQLEAERHDHERTRAALAEARAENDRLAEQWDDSGWASPEEVAALTDRAEAAESALAAVEQERDELSRAAMRTENGAAMLQHYVAKAQEAERERGHIVHVTAEPVAEDAVWCDECEEWVTSGAPAALATPTTPDAREALAKAWDEGYDTGYEDQRYRDTTKPMPPNPYRETQP